MSSLLAQLLFEAEVSIASLGIKADAVGDFYCSHYLLTSLAGAPKYVGGSFDCRVNLLTSLAGAPEHVSGDFYCHNNKLTSLAGAPEHVSGDFYCHDNKLTSLAGAPEHVGGGFDCRVNQLTSLVGAPKRVGWGFYCDPGIALASIPLMHIGGEVVTGDDELDTIINKHLNTGRRGCLALQQELIDAGYDVEAELVV